MIDFAVQIEGEEQGRWVLDVDPATDRILVSGDDQQLRWVPFSDCKVIKAANPDTPRPVVMVQPQGPKLQMPAMFPRLPGGN